MFSFTNRIKVKGAGPEDQLAKNLDACLLRAANLWYTEKISKVTRTGLRHGSVDDWCEALEKRFCEAPGKALAALEQTRYTVQDVREGKSPIRYVSNVILHGPSSGIAPTEYAQLLLAYEHIDRVLRRDIT